MVSARSRFFSGFFLIILALLAPLGAAAKADNLVIPSAAQVLDTAKVSRSDFIQVCSDVERFAATLPASTDLYPYIMILDRLDALRAGYGLDAFGANPVKHLAQILTREALKWIRFDTDPWDFLDQYLRWAPDDNRQSAVSSQSYYLADAVTIGQLMHWNDVSGKAVATLRTAGARPYVLSSFQDLQGIVIGKILRMESLTDDVALDIINGCHSVQGLTEIVEVLEQQAYAKSNPNQLVAVLQRALASEAAVKQLTVPTPSYLNQAPGQILLELMQKILFAGAAPRPEQVPAIIAALPGRESVDLGALLVQLGIIGLKPAQAPFLWDLSRSLVTVYTQLGLHRELLDLQTFIGKVKLVMLAGTHGYEGTYRVTVGGISTLLTLANTSGGTFIAGLSLPIADGNEAMYIDYSFMHILYDAPHDRFIATRFEINDTEGNNDTDGANNVLIFRVADGKIEGTFFNNGGSRHVSGKLVQPYEVYAAAPAITPETLTGTYVGIGNNGADLRIDLVEAGPRASANLFYNGMDMDVHFTMGWVNPTNNVVYLTTPELGNGRWLQIRGQIHNGVFSGEYIGGGEGLKFGKLHLRRVGSKL